MNSHATAAIPPPRHPRISTSSIDSSGIARPGTLLRDLCSRPGAQRMAIGPSCFEILCGKGEEEGRGGKYVGKKETGIRSDYCGRAEIA